MKIVLIVVSSSVAAVAGLLLSLKLRKPRVTRSSKLECPPITECIGYEECKNLLMQPHRCPPCIKTIVVHDPRLSFFPPLIASFTDSLTKLDISGSITNIPWCISQLQSLEMASFANNSLHTLPAELFLLSNLRHLNVGGNKLEALGPQVSGLKSLQLLNCMGCGLKEVPDTIGSLPHLCLLGLKSNQLTALPPTFTNLTSLVELFITDNMIEEFPAGFGRMTGLVKVQASFNSLTSIPEEIGDLPRLEMLRVAVCKISTLPDSINSPTPSKWNRLAWFSLGGNPSCAPPPSRLKDVVVISSDEIDVHSQSGKLGDGASGEVFLATINSEQVALKIFKSDVSPDGQVKDEVDISTSILHPNITRVRGVINKEDGQASALILDLCEGSPLAKKPTSQHLLRCKWDGNVTFPVDASLKIAHGVASALNYLHQHNICHGDVYAHNILFSEAIGPTLCDFGAAFKYQPQQRPFWERMEVLAYGLFLTDLVRQTRKSEPQSNEAAAKLDLMQSTASRCCSVDQRPTFEEIHLLFT